MRDQSLTRSPLLEVYLQQQRFGRLRSLRAIARTLTIIDLVVLIATGALLEWTVPSTPHLRGLIGTGVAFWLTTLALDLVVHSNRLNSRMVMMRLLSVRAELEELEELGMDQPPDENPQRPRRLAS